MIKGLGVDIIKVDRLRRSVQRMGDRFLERVFTPAEIEYCKAKRDPHPSFAARFAAKEATIKALGGRKGVSLTDIVISVNPTGKPEIIVGAGLKPLFSQRGINNVHLSLTHEKDYAAAIVVLEG